MAKDENVVKTTVKKEDGVIILLLGETGVGRSSFINAAAGKTLAKVGEDSNVDSCTSCVECFVVAHHEDPQFNVIFVDTPGFNNSSKSKSDGKILKEIIDWLKTSCHMDAQFGGIIYLQDLDGPHIQQKKRMVYPGKLTRPEPARRVVLATVKGNDVLASTAERRQEQFAASFWKEAAEGGPETHRYMRTKDSAWGIVDTILPSRKNTVELRLIQEEDIQYLTHTLKSKERHTLGKYDTLMASATQLTSERHIENESDTQGQSLMTRSHVVTYTYFQPI